MGAGCPYKQILLCSRAQTASGAGGGMDTLGIPGAAPVPLPEPPCATSPQPWASCKIPLCSGVLPSVGAVVTSTIGGSAASLRTWVGPCLYGAGGQSKQQSCLCSTCLSGCSPSPCPFTLDRTEIFQRNNKIGDWECNQWLDGIGCKALESQPLMVRYQLALR